MPARMPERRPYDNVFGSDIGACQAKRRRTPLLRKAVNWVLAEVVMPTYHEYTR